MTSTNAFAQDAAQFAFHRLFPLSLEQHGPNIPIKMPGPVRRQLSLGDAEHGADIGIIDYSRKETEEMKKHNQQIMPLASNLTGPAPSCPQPSPS